MASSLATNRREQLFYGFIHGNWALDNSRPDGRCCGVNNELEILRETGCYADFTLPSAPDPTQTRTINSIYYAVDDPIRPKSHDRGIPVGSGLVPSNALMMYSGTTGSRLEAPQVGYDPSNRERLHPGESAGDDRSSGRLAQGWRTGAHTPRLVFRQAPHPRRARVEPASPARLSRCSLSSNLAQRAGRTPSFRFHYVTAREMFNLVRAAENDWQGPVSSARDYQLTWEDWRSTERRSLHGQPARIED